MLDCQSTDSSSKPITVNTGMALLRLGLLLNLSTLLSACGSSDAVLTSPALGEAARDTVFIEIPQGENPASTVSTPTRPEPGDTEQEITGTALPEFVPGGSMPTGIIEENVAPESPTIPVVTVAGCSAAPYDMQARTLQLFNEARAEARMCGSESYAAVLPLTWNASLATAASVQSQDMATNNFFSHTGSDGSSASIRVSTAGYYWQTVGENIAGGRATVFETIEDWLESPGHCRNIMNPAFTEVALSCAEDRASDYRRYWTNILAAPL